jgi:hypothetical protein
MTIPFVDLLNKAKARLFPAAADSTPAQPRPAPMEKPSSGRLGKTFLPNTIRTVTSPDPMKVATASARVAKAASASELRPVEASSRPAAAHSHQLPRASVLGLEPKMERTISLQLADILEQMPAGYVKSQEAFDPARSIPLNASEIEKGMAESKPSVSLASIYKEAPEIFARRLSPADLACVPLPYEKVLDQFKSLRVRPDQVHDHTVPQLDTPFLKVTLEDTERFGTTMEPLRTSALPPVRVEPAIAETIAAAAPEPIASETIKRRRPPLLRPSISLHDPASDKQEASQTKAPAPVGPKKISIHLPPNGTGAPASERVPASSGPPVPTSLPAPPRAGETRFTSVTAPCEDLRPKFQRGSPARPAREVAAALSPPKRDETKIALALNRLLQEVPAFQLNGSPSAVPENVRVELPLSLIQPQLASGRVVISPTVLQRAMPEIYRPLLNVDPGETPISLPLEEILKNLPTTTLRLRDDQEVTVIAETFETTFSIKADEDARRLHAGAGLAPKASEKPAEQPQIQEKAETAREDLPALASANKEKPEAKSVVALASAFPGGREAAVAEPSQAAISIKAGEEAERFQTRPEPVPKISEKPAEYAQVPKKIEMERKEPSRAVLAKEEKLDAKSVLGRACALAGVAACAIAFADDGLTLAGSLPAELAADGLCAMAPSLLQKIDNHMRGTKLGLFTAMTLHCAQWPLTFFMHGNICLTALHAGGELTSETRAELTRITQELSRTYSQPEPSSHVDH